MLKDKEQDKADIDKVLKFYDNSHTPPSHKTITRREIGARKTLKGYQRRAEQKVAQAARVRSGNLKVTVTADPLWDSAVSGLQPRHQSD